MVNARKELEALLSDLDKIYHQVGALLQDMDIILSELEDEEDLSYMPTSESIEGKT